MSDKAGLDLTPDEASELMKSLLGRIMAQKKKIDQLELILQPSSSMFAEALVDVCNENLGATSLLDWMKAKGKQYEQDFMPELKKYGVSE